MISILNGFSVCMYYITICRSGQIYLQFSLYMYDLIAGKRKLKIDNKFL